MFGSFPGGSVSLDTIPQVGNHLVDLPLQLVHFTRRVDRDQLGKVTIGGGIGNFSESADL